MGKCLLFSYLWTLNQYFSNLYARGPVLDLHKSLASSYNQDQWFWTILRLLTGTVQLKDAALNDQVHLDITYSFPERVCNSFHDLPKPVKETGTAIVGTAISTLKAATWASQLRPPALCPQVAAEGSAARSLLVTVLSWLQFSPGYRRWSQRSRAGVGVRIVFAAISNNPHPVESEK